MTLRSLVLLAAGAARAWAQAAPTTTAPREQLAASYLRLELAMQARPLTPDQLRPVNRAFDAASLAFFAGRTSQTLATVDSLARTIVPDSAARAAIAREAEARLASMPAKGRAVTVGTSTIRYRVFVPSSLPAGPRPLVVAFHGAGGDENMFLEGYGAGRISALGDRHGAIVVTPFTNAMMQDGGARFDALLADLQRTFAIDTTRIVLLGHSLGTGVVWRLAAERPSRIAAVACVAGGCGQDVPMISMPEQLPRALVFAGELDPLAAPARVEAAVAAGRGKGRMIDYRLVPNYGHTLLVGAVLPDVFTWFFP